MSDNNSLFNTKLDNLSDLIYTINKFKNDKILDDENKKILINNKKVIFNNLIKIVKDFDTEIEKRNKLRELNELLKIEKILSMIFDNIKDNSIVIFLNFTRSINLLLNLIEYQDKKLFEITAVISKNNGNMQRNDDVSKFQRDEIHLMIISIRAGGVGISLHDKNKIRPRISITSLSDNDFDITQALGRIYRLGTKSDVKQYILLLDTPLDMKIFNNFTRKSKNMKLIHDGSI